jgi:predicted small lipoprotein YifL
MSVRGSLCAAALALAGLAIASCGKKGPPLAPLRLVPAPATDVVARRIESEVELRFTLPTTNQNGPGPIALDRIEVYAITLAPSAPTVANRDLLVKERLVGTVQVKPPSEEGEPDPPVDPADTRPAPGERAAFVDELNEDELKPVVLQPSADSASGPTPSEVAAKVAARRGEPSLPAVAAMPEAGAVQSAPAYPVRVYALRGVTRGGRPGPPAQRVAVPLLSPPTAPGRVEVKFTEQLFLITWIPPVEEPGASLGFNVYASAKDRLALNATPLTAAAFEHGPVSFGEERCFAVRSVQTVQNVAIESAASETACATPRDIFAPAAPRGLQVVAGPDGVSLSWDANSEPDLGGYVVLRAEAPGETLQPLTSEPIREPNYRDTTVQSGIRYVYALVAVDKATPPNTSALSERQEVTAR